MIIAFGNFPDIASRGRGFLIWEIVLRKTAGVGKLFSGSRHRRDSAVTVSMAGCDRGVIGLVAMAGQSHTRKLIQRVGIA